MTENFWKMVKPTFSNVNPMSDKIILIEDEKVITDDTEIAESFNTYFLNITDSLGLTFPEDSFTKDLDTMVTNAVEKYKNHPGIKAINTLTPNGMNRTTDR